MDSYLRFCCGVVDVVFQSSLHNGLARGEEWHEWQKHFRGRNWEFSADLHTQKSICIQLEKTSWLVINIKHTQLANADRFSCSSLPVLHKPHSANTIWIISMMRPNRPSNWTTLEPNPTLNVGFREYLHTLRISSGHRPLSTSFWGITWIYNSTDSGANKLSERDCLWWERECRCAELF